MCREAVQFANERPRAWKRFEVLVAPPVLFLQLKRWHRGRDALGRIVNRDLFHDVALDKRLTLRSRVAGDVLYDLAGVICHGGAHAKSGHYTARSRRGDLWFKYDDVVRRMLCDNESLARGAEKAYLLAYERS